MARSVVVVVVMLCLTLAAASMWRQLDRPVRIVRVEGPLSPAEQQAIRAVVSGGVAKGLLSVDVSDLCRRIRALSWPRSVAVRRLWPDTLLVHVEKESVVAAWGDGGYLTSAGRVVKLADGVQGLPVLATAVAAPQRAMEVYQMLQSRVAPAGLSIARLDESALGEWVITFDDDMTVALGRSALAERLDRFLLAYRKVLSRRSQPIAHVDLRYDSGLAVAWAPESTVGAISRSRPNSRPGDRAHGVGDQPEAQYAVR